MAAGIGGGGRGDIISISEIFFGSIILYVYNKKMILLLKR
jgi:hypothetical protein